MPKVGDKVRVTSEGTVVSVTKPGASIRGDSRGKLLVERSDGRRGMYFFGPGCHTELEILEPAYVDDGVYKDADGEFYQYNGHDDNWYEFGSDIPCWNGHPTRPLTRIDI